MALGETAGRRLPPHDAAAPPAKPQRPPGNAPHQAPANPQQAEMATREPGTIRVHPRQSASKPPSAPGRREEFGAAEVAVAVGVLAVELGAETLAVLLERDGGRVGDVLLVWRQDAIAVHVHLPERETHSLQGLLQRHPPVTVQVPPREVSRSE